MTKIDCWDWDAFGIDQHGKLWIWGEHLGTEEWERSILFKNEGIYAKGRPLICEQFNQNNDKVLDIACGKVVTHVKVESGVDGSISFYAIINQVCGKVDEEKIFKYHKIVGLESMNDCFGNYVK